ncbi:MAG TPA: FlgD immunoglobulin-like domain containing protein, partial [Nitriliruptorales bacterium]
IDLAARVGDETWFGVGFAADGWDLSGSLGEMVFWKMAGGGGLPVANRPMFRVYYNAAPKMFALTTPADGSSTGAPRPNFSWDPATDPNGDQPITYVLRLGSDPTLASAFELSAGTATSILPPFDLALGQYYWEVTATDPGGASRTSVRSGFRVGTSTAAPTPLTMARAVSAAPNPFNPRTTLSFSTTAAGTVQLWIVDGRGRRVDSVVQGWLPAGDHTATWNGTDATGRVCASGVYRAVLDVDGVRSVTSLSLVK